MTAGHSQVRDFPFTPTNALDLEPVLAELRHSEPVSRIRLPYGGSAWLVTRYRDVCAVLTDARLRRSAAVGRDVPRRQESVAGPAGIILYTDPPAHTRLNRLVRNAFSDDRVHRLRARTDEIAAELVGGMAAAGSPADLVEWVARPLPRLVICHLLGIPETDQQPFDDGVAGLLASHEFPADELRGRVIDLHGYLGGLVAARLAEPTDDLIGALVSAREDGDRLSGKEIVALALTLLAGGLETMVSEIANFTYVLLRHPGQLAALRADPGLLPSAVRELLRYVPLGTGSHTALIAAEDLEIGGVPISRGDAVFVHLQSANRDHDRFTDPDTLDLAREPNPHLSLGHGPHYCVGAHLATMELEAALGAIVARFPNLALDIEDERIEWRPQLLARGPVALPVRW